MNMDEPPTTAELEGTLITLAALVKERQQEIQVIEDGVDVVKWFLSQRLMEREVPAKAADKDRKHPES